MAHFFIIISNGGPAKAGTIFEEFDDGVSKVVLHPSGQYSHSEELRIPKSSILPFAIPFNLKGQWDLTLTGVKHRASADGSVKGAIMEGLLNPTPTSTDNDEDYWGEFSEDVK